MIAANPRRYFLLKNAYKHGFIHELLDPNHCAIGVIICKNSSSDVVISGLPGIETSKNAIKIVYIYSINWIQLVGINLFTEFDASKDQIQR